MLPRVHESKVLNPMDSRGMNEAGGPLEVGRGQLRLDGGFYPAGAQGATVCDDDEMALKRGMKVWMKVCVMLLHVVWR